MESVRALLAGQPVFAGKGIREISSLVGLTDRPTSLLKVCDYLSPPVLFQCPTLHAQTMHANGAVAIHATGEWAFAGHAHENGVVGDNYALGFALHLLDQNGNALASIHEKSLAGTVSPGSRDDDFTVTGFDQRLADKWHEIRLADGDLVSFRLHASTDALQVVEAVTVGLAAAAAATGIVLLGIEFIPQIPRPVISIIPADDGIGFVVKFTWVF